MKTTQRNTDRQQQLSARFAPEVEFELSPVPGAVPPETVRIKFDELQSRLVEATLGESNSRFIRGRIDQAAREAAALAWTTPYPLLVLPELFLEKAREAGQRLDKQRRVLQRSERLVEAIHNWDAG
ncbi:MAG: hypothetical protein FJ398_00635 [Verrucomicrobia bacterium]|nr:hypothetical protein [Verrucomicrobiota bacterium]